MIAQNKQVKSSNSNLLTIQGWYIQAKSQEKVMLNKIHNEKGIKMNKQFGLFVIYEEKTKNLFVYKTKHDG